MGSPSPPVLPCGPHGRDESGGAEQQWGNTHIWVLRAQCWLWGRQAGEEETEKQSRLSPKDSCTHLTE